VDNPGRPVPKVLATGYLAVVGFSMAGALASRVFHLEAQAVAQVSSLLVLTLATLNIGWLIGRPWVCLAVMALGGVVEAVGVTTGFPFGAYTYTDAWWPTVALPTDGRFPVAVPLAWLLIVGGLWLVIGSKVQGWRRAMVVGLAAALFDAPLEDLMTNHLGYWHWKEVGPVFGAPTMNSIGWFLTAMVASLFLGGRAPVAADKPAALVLAAYSLLMTEMAVMAFRPSWPLWLVITAVFGALAWKGWARSQQ